MQRAFRFLFVTITAIYLSLGHLFAQSQTTNNHTNFPWFGGVQGGASLFWGDLKMNTFWPSL
ncbi:MAG: hypothetical protein JW729_08435, partial [Bacteroidales bacterium]|nr:hypothetical protein [Bacteroidales bacterium]